MLSGENICKICEKPNSIPRLLSAGEVAEILRISRKTVNKLAREGRLGFVQVTAKERLFTEEQVGAYIDAQSNRPEEIRIDTQGPKQLSCRHNKGGEKSFGVSKADLRKEMRLWQ